MDDPPSCVPANTDTCWLTTEGAVNTETSDVVPDGTSPVDTNGVNWGVNVAHAEPPVRRTNIRKKPKKRPVAGLFPAVTDHFRNPSRELMDVTLFPFG